MSTAFLRGTAPVAYVSGPDLSRIVRGEFYGADFLPAYEARYASAPISFTHAFAFDAATMLFDALEISAVTADDGTLTIGRTALRDAAYAIEGYQGLSGTLSCSEDGECAGTATVGVFEVPALPIEGGDMTAEPVFTETLSASDLEP
jgi:ABC-type branched-subunit amino acid transport system substrate-binding protein